MDELNIKDVIAKTRDFDTIYPASIPVGKWEVGLMSYKRRISEKSGMDMIELTVSDQNDREARTYHLLELKYIGNTIKLIKGIYTHNQPEDKKESTKKLINGIFDKCLTTEEAQNKCEEILKNMIEKAYTAWILVEEKEGSKYLNRNLYAYEPELKVKDNSEDVISSGTEITNDNIDYIFNK